MAGPEEGGVIIRDLTVNHDRHVTPSMGTVKVGRWTYPARVFEGVTQYQGKDGAWVDLTGTVEEEPPAE